MIDDDLLCEAPGPNGVRCILPMNHRGNNHQYDVQLPDHVGNLVAGYVDELEKQIRFTKRARWWLLGATIANLAAATWNVVSIITRP